MNNETRSYDEFRKAIDDIQAKINAEGQSSYPDTRYIDALATARSALEWGIKLSKDIPILR